MSADRDDLARVVWSAMSVTHRHEAREVADAILAAGYTRAVRDAETLTDDEAAHEARRLLDLDEKTYGWNLRDLHDVKTLLRRLVRDVKPDTETKSTKAGHWCRIDHLKHVPNFTQARVHWHPADTETPETRP